MKGKGITKQDIAKVQYAEQLLMKDLRIHTKIAELAYSVGLSEKKLKYIFKLIYGKGVYAHLKDMRLEKAKEMLVNSEKPIKEIAARLGYKDQSNFTRAFGKKNKMTPAEFRVASANVLLQGNS
jgi:AraC family transcriptional activator of pyochelin receptor